jgi:hypothetical protein
MTCSSSDDRRDNAGGAPFSGSFLSLARAEALTRCCDAVADRPADRSVVKAALRELCACAHRDGIFAEQLLVEIKQALAESARRRGLTSVEANAERARFVTLAIDTYYGRQ